MGVRSRGSKRNIGNVLAGYLTNCYKLRRAFSRPSESAASHIPSLRVAFRTEGVVRLWLSADERYGADHMVHPYVRTIATLLTLILSIRGVRRCSATTSGRWNLPRERKRARGGRRGSWMGLGGSTRRRVLIVPSERRGDPAGEMFVCGRVDLIKSRRICAS